MDSYKSIELTGRQQRHDHIYNRSIVSSRRAYGLKISDRFRIVEIPRRAQLSYAILLIRACAVLIVTACDRVKIIPC